MHAFGLSCCNTQSSIKMYRAWLIRGTITHLHMWVSKWLPLSHSIITGIKKKEIWFTLLNSLEMTQPFKYILFVIRGVVFISFNTSPSHFSQFYLIIIKWLIFSSFYSSFLAICPDDYCQNGGICIVLDQSERRFCSCPSGYGGDRCEICK